MWMPYAQAWTNLCMKHAQGGMRISPLPYGTYFTTIQVSIQLPFFTQNQVFLVLQTVVLGLFIQTPKVFNIYFINSNPWCKCIVKSSTPKSVQAGTKNSCSEGLLLAKHKHTNIPTMMEPFAPPVAWFCRLSIPHPPEPLQKGLAEAAVTGF